MHAPNSRRQCQVHGGAPALTRRKINLLCAQQTNDRMCSGKTVSGRKRILSLVINESFFWWVPVFQSVLNTSECQKGSRYSTYCFCLYLCLVAAKRLYCEWSGSVSTSQCTRGMPRACSVGLVENGQRAPSERKGALQDGQVSFTLTLTPPPPPPKTTLHQLLLSEQGAP